MHMWQYSSTMMCVLGSFLLAPATRFQQSWLEEKERSNGGRSAGSGSRAEDEMRNLVSDAMEGVGHKRPEGRRRHSSNAGASGDRRSSEAGASNEGSKNGVQQYGNMQVVT